MTYDLRIRAARPSDGPAIAAVLERCGLPTDDVIRLVEHFHVAVMDEQLVGCAGAERIGEIAVIRSVAVLPSYRDQGVATHLVQAVLMRARSGGARRAVLVSAACPTYFTRYGFSLVPAAKLPGEVLASREFDRQRGADALCMACELT